MLSGRRRATPPRTILCPCSNNVLVPLIWVPSLIRVRGSPVQNLDSGRRYRDIHFWTLWLSGIFSTALAAASQERVSWRIDRSERQSSRGFVMRSQRLTRLKGLDKLSGALIARRYLDLQKLREKVREAEIRFGLKGSKKPRSHPGTCARDQKITDILSLS